MRARPPQRIPEGTVRHPFLTKSLSLRTIRLALSRPFLGLLRLPKASSHLSSDPLFVGLNRARAEGVSQGISDQHGADQTYIGGDRGLRAKRDAVDDAGHLVGTDKEKERHSPGCHSFSCLPLVMFHLLSDKL